MFRSLTLSNFKAFRDAQRIPLRPLTLLFGANSSGKSSVIQSLLMLKQTLECSDEPETALLTKGRLINLGVYRDLVFGHDLSANLGVCIEVDPARTKGYENLGFAGTRTGALLTTFRSAGVLASVEQMALVTPSTRECLVCLEPADPESIDSTSGDGQPGLPFVISQVTSEPKHYEAAYEVVRTQLLPAALRRQKPKVAGLERLPSDSRVPEQRAILSVLEGATLQRFIREQQQRHDGLLARCVNFLPDFGWQFRSWGGTASSDSLLGSLAALAMRPISMWGPAIEETSAALRQLLSAAAYVGPLRAAPERHYTISGAVPGQVGPAGNATPELLYLDSQLVRQVNAWLREAEIGYRLTPRGARDSAMADMFTVRLRDKILHVSVSSADVGFGVSQLLPIIVQCMLQQSHTILIEQPEVHLHPRLQAELGSLFTNAIREPWNNQLIVETHSEHLILRVQREIRRGNLEPKDVAVVHIMKTREGARATEIRLGKDGRFLDRWPQGFFEEGFLERFTD